ncbi:hypothetical protein SERLA73DRAFT_73629 [Serpula lacrymans var. lacrymans S7.3]|uniref:Uncharacterized protein n=1 Tax=Serpula lacrymans var. lacrymans (strain S7.3) TaxID=936435 RepID=F8PYU4_SERL3|nr:hypothetical protein SERLA73DRAFT_73629 [Serpula lacrymans var. lacrymans S7.3]
MSVDDQESREGLASAGEGRDQEDSGIAKAIDNSAASKASTEQTKNANRSHMTGEAVSIDDQVDSNTLPADKLTEKTPQPEGATSHIQPQKVTKDISRCQGEIKAGECTILEDQLAKTMAEPAELKKKNGAG